MGLLEEPPRVLIRGELYLLLCVHTGFVFTVSASELTQLQTLLGGLRAPGTAGAGSSQGNFDRQVAIDLSDVIAGGQVVETAKNNAGSCDFFRSSTSAIYS